MLISFIKLDYVFLLVLIVAFFSILIFNSPYKPVLNKKEKMPMTTFTARDVVVCLEKLHD